MSDEETKYKVIGCIILKPLDPRITLLYYAYKTYIYSKEDYQYRMASLCKAVAKMANIDNDAVKQIYPTYDTLYTKERKVIVDTSFFEVGQFLQLCIFVYLEGSKEQIMKTVNSSDDLVYAHFFDTLEGSTVEKSMTENRRIFEQDLKVAH